MNNSMRPNHIGRRLRIAQLAPLYESVPPQLYGGTERVVSFITEELCRRGHDVTLFASGDSVTAARLEAVCPTGLRLAGKPELASGLQLTMLSGLYKSAVEEFDIIHSHLDFWTFPFETFSRVPTVSTMHGRLDDTDSHPVYNRYPRAAVVSISDSQREPLPAMNWVATVPHGLPRDLLPFNDGTGKYLAFLGRISPEKGPDTAIEVARRAGIPLKIAAKVDDADREYFEAVIKPRLDPPAVEYMGEINGPEKSEFLGGALALLFTIDWPEPFGLVMIEAMACGTPVIARPCGAIPEVLNHGVSGFIAKEIDDLVAAVRLADGLSRTRCRQEFERWFTVETMVDRYENIYAELIEQSQNARARALADRAHSDAGLRRAQPSAGSFKLRGGFRS
jgi:glycosyltransferase involved in cell wall biosynthesis